MADILHRVGTTASRDTVYQALTTVDGLAAWWTTDTKGSDGDMLRFRFGDVGGFDMKVLELRPDTRVRWEVVDGPEEWIGTTVTFDLKQEGEWTIILFAHEGWREQVEFMNHCTTKWALFLMSLKSLAETGAGAPHPHDVRISDWH
ncbi:SRPBCC domain-containing protein [Streptomyces populi]|uniref:SRPBCC domain-containing protein n=1 Tax=Streptomyces populi TaxID=2058924 RepID=A0A2I0SLV7_9ACTN|nr:SRPBCC domain-containing protein [Streptomyces populi]PKT70925.1 SRPBCC domain-containing protein [Streptomyces populi]